MILQSFHVSGSTKVSGVPECDNYSMRFDGIFRFALLVRQNHRFVQIRWFGQVHWFGQVRSGSVRLDGLVRFVNLGQVRSGLVKFDGSVRFIG